MQASQAAVQPESFAQRSIVCAMSGGVDSSVAAYILAKEGHHVVGVSMQVWDYRKNSGNASKASCCAPSDFCDARRVAGSLDIPYYVFDLEEVFRKEVIDKFISTYHSGMTPNPCVDCNAKVKFNELRRKAEAIGCEAVATGHYAQIRESAQGFHLFRGRDPEKDQSYFLYNLKQSELANTLFPVGHMTKPEVREIAREAGIATAEKAESQDICFVQSSVGDFVMKIGGSKNKAGRIVGTSGVKLGEHDGIENFTVGQRKGVKIGGAPEPLYVVELKPDTGEVVVGNKKDLERESFTLQELNWVAPGYAKLQENFEIECIAQLRSRHRGVPVTVKVGTEGSAQVFWKNEWATVSPGQACVLYTKDNQEVIGGGRISR